MGSWDKRTRKSCIDKLKNSCISITIHKEIERDELRHNISML